MTASQTQMQRLRVAHLNPNAPTPFLLRPDANARATIAGGLGLTDLPRLEFQGEIRAEGRDGWRLSGHLRARVVQPCVITLAAVGSDLDEQVTRLYSPDFATPEGDEVEMPDETIEPLGQFIDLSAAMIEELTLALPEYPRADGAQIPADARDRLPPSDTRRPFAGLDKMLKGRDS
ncbi:YceD family protein [Paracoccus sp. (in: a-proteobacteria)]|uniref:YceD family protein n=1 Tax=Paracoccus sp. TaxID=267 RepID=UPI003A8B37DE